MIKNLPIIYVVTFILSFSTLKSQVQFGVKGSLQFTNVRNVHKNSETRAFAPAVGLFAQIPLNDYNDNWFFKPEIVYSEQGEKDGKDMNVKFYQTYINVPLMIKFYFSDFFFPPCCRGRDTHEFFIEAGPQLGYLISQKNKLLDKKWYGGVSKLDISAGVGGGISFLRKHEIGVRYNFGLNDIYKNNNYYSKDGKWLKIHNTSNIGVSYFYFF
ncbi:porin family protein [Apibacter sp.]|uniref:porin family protein n=1 Tax=Apibacter sp. TaxID=2023709 RepID=UPI0025DF4334|nr:porin family protein [Apibacter sp.]MCT6869976.1 PorT family protein [Apibacter sp.]